MATITINNTEYKVKYSLRALFIFESIKGSEFKLETNLDRFLFFYSMILAANKDKELKWDDFIDAIEEDETILGKLAEAASDSKDNIFYKEEVDGTKKKS